MVNFIIPLMKKSVKQIYNIRKKKTDVNTSVLKGYFLGFPCDILGKSFSISQVG